VKILYVSQYFPPEMGAPAARAVELARHWSSLGQEVTVLTGFPNHPTGFVPPEWRPRLRRLVYRETVDGVRVVRTWLLTFPNRKAYERMLNYGSFCVSAALRGLEIPRPDVVIATSPQLLVGLSGWWVARWKRAPLVFEVRDLWPESLAAVGAGSENSVLHRILFQVAGFLYRNARHIAVVTPAFKDHLIRHWALPPEKISVVENGVEIDLFHPGNKDPALRRELNAEGKFLACYVGTMGMAHGLDTVIDAAKLLRAQLPNAILLLVGEGADKERIKSLAAAESLTSLRFVDQQPRERIPAFINASDVCLVLLKKTELFKTVIPTKMLEFLSCGRPVILGVDGQARQLIEEARGGIVIEPENAEALAAAIRRLAADAALCEMLGKNGRSYIVERYSRRQTAEQYLEILRELVSQTKVKEDARRA
jgi:colanic acid biosynthesis glycosyl transferase WcaI